ncbi:hypothetical protein C8R44DRAFT_733094 [Mycena epipterygia]|nr:hypothetical protein C8R44DRAFT_733094 [Mycena epipterygia]
MDSRSSHLSELECHGAIVNLLWSDVAVLDNSTADVRNFIASVNICTSSYASGTFMFCLLLVLATNSVRGLPGSQPVFLFRTANLTLGWSGGLKWPAVPWDPPPGDLSPVQQVMQSISKFQSPFRQAIGPSELASEASTPSSAGDTATSHGSSLLSSTYPLHLADCDPKAKKMPVEDTQLTKFIMKNLPELLFADVQTNSLQYGQVSSSAPIKPPHDLADTETEKLKSMKWQKSAQSKRTLRCYTNRSTGQNKILDYGGTAAYI